MRFKSLGSGSTGNAWVVEKIDAHGVATRILIDCGFTQKELLNRLGQAGLEPADLTGVFVTHEHSDHLGCAVPFARRWGLPLWMSEGTALSLKETQTTTALNLMSDGQAFEVGSMRLTPFTVPHDAREPLQLRIDDGRRRLGLLTDLGRVTDYVIQNVYNCHALVIESNHDAKMLAESNYPWVLKRRVSSEFGHLSNDIATAFLQEVKHTELQHVVAAHLSLQNNQAALVAQNFSEVLKCAPEDVTIANATEGTPWMTIL